MARRRGLRAEHIERRDTHHERESQRQVCALSIPPQRCAQQGDVERIAAHAAPEAGSALGRQRQHAGPDFAQAGGKDASKLDDALAMVYELIA